MSFLLKFENVSKYFNEKIIVDNVSFSIKQSSINMLIGPNGSGKTTLSKLLLGITHPTSGRIIKSKDNIKIGYVPQRFFAAKEMPFTVIDLLESLNITQEELTKFNLINKKNLESISKYQISNLSGGQLQKLLLSIALSNSPDIIVLDEPTSHLDLESTENFFKIIEDVRSSYHTSIFMVSHDLHTVINTADQILCINHKICCKDTNFSESEIIKGNISIYNHRH